MIQRILTSFNRLPLSTVATLPALLSLLVMQSAVADTATILIVSSSDTDLYQRFQQTFREALPDNPGSTSIPETVYMDHDGLSRERVDLHTDLIVTIGSRAARAVATLELDIPVINGLIPVSVYRTLSDNSVSCLQQSAVFIDQPISRQGLLARLVFPQRLDYGVLLGPVSMQRQPEVETVIRETGQRITIRTVDRDGSTMAAGRELITDSDLLLAVNDPLVLNRGNAKWLLYVAYQRRIPVIGFSKAYVNAGAAAAVYSEPGQMARQVAELVTQWQRSDMRCLAEPEFSRYFSVAINLAVCNSLDCEIDDEDKLTRLIMELEQP